MNMNPTFRQRDNALLGRHPCHIAAAILLQAVPVVFAAEAGSVCATTFTNAVEDFCRLATRKTLVT